MRESVFSTREQQAQRTTCDHAWVPLETVHLVFDYIEVDRKCSTCGTYGAARGLFGTYLEAP